MHLTDIWMSSVVLPDEYCFCEDIFHTRVGKLRLKDDPLVMCCSSRKMERKIHATTVYM